MDEQVVIECKITTSKTVPTLTEVHHMSQQQSSTLEARYTDYLKALAAQGFKGEIAHQEAPRVVFSTDNSIYQRTPQAIIFPVDTQDMILAARLGEETAFQQIVLTARGGGTGTNAQSLTDGVVIDVSRHMNRILDIDIERGQVRVQAGVVKDQLNAALKPHGLFFAPELSTSNRATIGGMINTDASGQGSCEYGKTRDHVLSLEMVLLGGELFEAATLSDTACSDLIARGGHTGALIQTARDIVSTHHDEIQARFPPLNRCLTGYDLAHLRNTNGALDIHNLFCGAEGSLGFISEATLNVLPLPRCSALINVRYAGFMQALEDASRLMHSAGRGKRPTSIETVDDTVLSLAKGDLIWGQVACYFPDAPGTPTMGINLVEFNADDEATLNTYIQAFVTGLDQQAPAGYLGYTLAHGRTAMTDIYTMRKRAVGLLGNVQGERRPIPFVEDTAVPPECLAPYIAEFRALLDQHHLQYGMFGHVDAGVLHVRPAIDMKDPQQAKLIRIITDQVAELTQRYGGLLWGEHGKGVRSEYAPRYFGTLYPLLQAIKHACDPYNQLNPGKIATPKALNDAQPSQWALLRIDTVPTRGERDRLIAPETWQQQGAIMHCNGNGACYNYDPDDAMCPSWKGTRDRIHSPKGRAALFKEWILQRQDTPEDIRHPQPTGIVQACLSYLGRLRATLARRQGFEQQVYTAMTDCLACKSCTTQCPIKVDIPEARATFLAHYHRTFLRGPRDHLVGALEPLLPWLARIGPLYNALIGLRPIAWLIERLVGLVDMPTFSHVSLVKSLKEQGISMTKATPDALKALSPARRKRTVVLVPDGFTRYFDTVVMRDVIVLLHRLDLDVFMAPYATNGKPLQVHGFLRRFTRAATRQAKRLNALSAYDVPLLGIDPAMTLCYRQEYAKVLGKEQAPQVALLQEWLSVQADTLIRPLPRRAMNEPTYTLLAHCTEKTTAPEATQCWPELFKAFGLSLSLQASGCCGMSGTYGHEARHRETSKVIYDLSWATKVNQSTEHCVLMATGYSCRSQVKRFSQRTLLHPFQALLQAHQQRLGA